MFQNTLQNASSPPHLMYHGYDFSHASVWASPDRGHSPEVWDRAQGWYMMALVDTLDILASAGLSRSRTHDALLHILRTLAPRVVAAADAESGVWWLVMSEPGRAGNYFESSAAAMFVYAVLKGVRRGYLEDEGGRMVSAMRRAYGAITERFVVRNDNGTLDWLNTVKVGSLGNDSAAGTFEVSAC